MKSIQLEVSAHTKIHVNHQIKDDTQNNAEQSFQVYDNTLQTQMRLPISSSKQLASCCRMRASTECSSRWTYWIMNMIIEVVR